MLLLNQNRPVDAKSVNAALIALDKRIGKGNTIIEKEKEKEEKKEEGISSLSIGSIVMWFSESAPSGWFFCNHTKLSISDYAELYEKLKDIPQCQSEEEGFFYTPDFRDRVPQGANGNLGQLIEAGLPNIEGDFAGDVTNSSSFNGAFSKKSGSSVRGLAEASNSHTGIIDFNASNSNNIYGNSDTVQPPANACNFIIKALNVSESLDESVKVDDNKITTGNVFSAFKTMEEVEKVDSKNNYSTEEMVVGTWIDGKPIYRKVTQVSIATNSSAWRSTGVEIPQNIKKTIRRELILDFSSISPNTSFMLRYNNGFVDVASINNTNVNITTNDFIVLEYTKTTD